MTAFFETVSVFVGHGEQSEARLRSAGERQSGGSLHVSCVPRRASPGAPPPLGMAWPGAGTSSKWPCCVPRPPPPNNSLARTRRYRATVLRAFAHNPTVHRAGSAGPFVLCAAAPLPHHSTPHNSCQHTHTTHTVAAAGLSCLTHVNSGTWRTQHGCVFAMEPHANLAAAASP